ncbi:PAS domain-containing protein [Pedobacter sp. P351]|uniref:PAS domain-containing protein n=1 Tax=Pedobacter superstes TaxID=3133441 RepID=UPI0030960A27
MINFFSIPDKEKDYKSYMVYVLSILWTLVICSIVSIGFIFFSEIWQRWLIFLGTSIFITVFILTLIRYGYTGLASWALTIMLWLLITIPCYTAGGIMAPGILSQVSVILTAGFLLGWRGGLAIGLLTVVTDFFLAYMEIKGFLPIPLVTHNPITRWIGTIIPFGTILALQYYATNHLRSGLAAVQREVLKREKVEKLITKTVLDLEERVKELKTLYRLSRILQNDDTSIKDLVPQIAEILPSGWQHPEITAASVCIADIEYKTSNYQRSSNSQLVELKTKHGTPISIEIVYLQKAPESDEGPFLKEERHLINMLIEMIKINLESREHRTELKDYKYALDLDYIVAIAGVDSKLTFVNDNFCKINKYSAAELLGKHYTFISSDFHSPEYFNELALAMQDGKPFRGEFCNRAKDGILYWVDTSIVPFLDENGKVYQYLSISHDITERKNADDKIKQSEQLLKRITSQVPGNTYMFEIEENGSSKIHFISRGTDIFNHTYDFDELSENAEKLREVLHDDDKVKFNDAMKEAFKTRSLMSFQYRIIVDGHIRWRWMQAAPENHNNGKVLWYGATSDITPLVDYIASIEQIIFDIGHVIRRPVASMLGLSRLIIDIDLDEKEIKEISKKLYTIAEEMDKFIKELNQVYIQKKQNTELNIDISPVIDKRSSLFS